MLLSHDELLGLQEEGIIEYSEPDLVNSASIDIRLGRKLLIERVSDAKSLRRISLKNREPISVVEWDFMRDGPFILHPGEFILAHSHEVFNLPNTISAEYFLKSSMARIGLDHLKAGWCDAGWNGSVLTLELKNMTRQHEIVLEYLDKIGQMVFYRHKEVPKDRSYAARGRYNGDGSVSGSKVGPDQSLMNSRLRLIIDELDTEVD